MRARRAGYAVMSLALFVLAVLGVADLRGDVLGLDTDAVDARTVDGTELRVEYPSVTRPALASAFSIEVSRPDGFDRPVVLAISRPWIEVWDENGLYPTPDSETGEGEWVVYEFAPPDGNEFRFFYDARLEPARQEGVDGAVELRDEGDAILTVTFHTVVRP
jgi:hypothetical protein